MPSYGQRKRDSYALKFASKFYAGQEQKMPRWPDMTWGWETKRGFHLTGAGRFWVGFAAIAALVGFFAILLIPGHYQDVPNALGAGTMVGGFVLFITLVRSWADGDQLWYRDEETAAWTLLITATFVRLAKLHPDGTNSHLEINRSDAGEFQLLTRVAGFLKVVDSVRAWSLDRTTSISLLGRDVRFTAAPAGAKRGAPGRALGIWWPCNPQTALSLGRLMSRGAFRPTLEPVRVRARPRHP